MQNRSATRYKVFAFHTHTNRLRENAHAFRVHLLRICACSFLRLCIVCSALFVCISHVCVGSVQAVQYVVQVN